MSEVAERYGRVAAGFDARVGAIPDNGWSQPTPCTAWTVRELVGHVVSVHRAVVGGLDPSAPPAPATEADLPGAWRAAAAEIQAVLADPARASVPASGRFAGMALEELIGRLLCADTLVHTWDLARATRQAETLDPAAVTYAFEMLRPADDAIRGAGGYGPKVEPPPGADEQARFLSFLGRVV